jgi:hypothetical protein
MVSTPRRWNLQQAHLIVFETFGKQIALAEDELTGVAREDAHPAVGIVPDVRPVARV